VIRHQRYDHGAVGKKPDTFGDLAEILLERPVADELDVVEAHDAAALIADGRVTRRDVLHLGAEGLPYHTAPTGFEGPEDVDLFIGRRRAGQPKWVGGADAQII